MRGIVIFLRDDHCRPTIATWTCDLCLMDDKVSFDMTFSYGFKGLSIHIDFVARVGLEGGAYSRDKNTSAGTLAENGSGAYMREGAYSRDTTVLHW